MSDLLNFQTNYDLGKLPLDGTLVDTDIFSLQKFVSENDVYQFSIDEQSDLLIYLDIFDFSELAEDDADLYLYRDDNNNSQLDANDSLLDTSLDIGGDVLEINDLSQGQYFVRVEYYFGGEDESIDYQLGLIGNPDFSLTNNYNLGVLPSNGTLIKEERTLSRNGRDIYKFEIDRASKLHLALDVLDADDADLYLYRDDNNNGELDTDEYDLPLEMSLELGSDLIEIDEIGRGTYFASVEYYDGGTDEQIEYQLTANVNGIINLDSDIVYRFFHPAKGVHLYTNDNNERQAIQDHLPDYLFEGASFRAVNSGDENIGDVYRFFNSKTGVHLYTTDENERDSIIESLPDFSFEGAVFQAYETSVEGSIPVFRFYEPSIGVHFYTPNEAEKEFVDRDLDNYDYEGIAYYALPLNNESLL